MVFGTRLILNKQKENPMGNEKFTAPTEEASGTRNDRRQFLQTASVAAAGALLSASLGKSAIAAGSGKSNIIFMLADDLSFFNLASYGGSSFSTPHIDSMATKGLRFQYCFSSAVCSPTRAQLLTGCYAFRTGINNVMGPNIPSLDLNRFTTLANVLKKGGYNTGIAGKWHLFNPNRAPETIYKAHVLACGFNEMEIYQGADIVYGTPDNYAPDRHHAFAINFIQNHARDANPFFLYYAFGLPHFPFMPTPLNPTGQPRDRANYPFMMQYLDKLVGEVMQKVKSLGLEKNTYVFFAGDNGTDPNISVTCQGETIRGGKFSLNDTGCQVPCFVCGPGIQGGKTCSALIDFCDFYPTILDLAGLHPITGVDGKSFRAQLKKPAAAGVRQWIYVQHANQWCVRDAKWKYKSADQKLYNVTNTPFSEPAITSMTATDQAALTRLKTAGETLRVSPLPAPVGILPGRLRF
jgi:arylsulfatase A